MNLAVTNTRTIKLVKQHSMATFGGLCVVLAAVAGGVIAVSQTGSGTTPTVATRADYTWTRTSADDWRTIYYLVPTQELGDQILTTEAEQQNVIIENQGQLPARTIRVIVVDTPEQEQLVSSMMAEASVETTSFVDLRYPPLPAIEEGVPGEQNSEAAAGPVAVEEQLPAVVRQPQFGTADDAENAAKSLFASEYPAQRIPEAATVSGDRILTSAERIAEVAKRPDLPAVMYLHVATSQAQADLVRSVLSTEAAHFSANSYTGFEVVVVDSLEAKAALNLTINELHGHGITVVVVEPRNP